MTKTVELQPLSEPLRRLITRYAVFDQAVFDKGLRYVVLTDRCKGFRSSLF